MKRTAIKAGMVYAMTSKHGQPRPVVFLEDKAAGLWSRERGTIRRHQGTYTRTHRSTAWSSSPDTGYAAIVQKWDPSRGYGTAALPWKLDPAAELERFRADEPPSISGTRFEIIVSLAGIVSWDDAITAYEAEKAAERNAREEKQAIQARLKVAADRLQELGISASRCYPGRIELDISEAEKLLTMLPGRKG